MPITVQDNAAEHRYELYDDQALVGLAVYRRTGNQMAFTHTEVQPHRARRGLGSELIAMALDDVRSRRMQLLPYCRFVRDFVASHAEYQDLVPAARRASFGL